MSEDRKRLARDLLDNPLFIETIEGLKSIYIGHLSTTWDTEDMRRARAQLEGVRAVHRAIYGIAYPPPPDEEIEH